MLSRMHEKLGTAGFILAIVALIAAFGGAAYAAKEAGLNKKQKNEVKKIAKGATGPQGPQGPQGPAGPAGNTGAAGAAGADGKSVEAEAASVAKCSEGGTVFKINGTEVGKACNGEEGEEGEAGAEGSPWTAGGTLPAGKTETGSWAFAGTFSASANPSVDISFPIQLSAALDGSKVHLINKNGKELVLSLEEEKVNEVTSTACTGTAKVPTATAGNLCVYSGTLLLPNTQGFFASSFISNPGDDCVGIGCEPLLGGPGAGAGVSGAIVTFEYDSAGTRAGHGSWAVTG